MALRQQRNQLTKLEASLNKMRLSVFIIRSIAEKQEVPHRFSGGEDDIVKRAKASVELSENEALTEFFLRICSPFHRAVSDLSESIREARELLWEVRDHLRTRVIVSYQNGISHSEATVNYYEELMYDAKIYDIAQHQVMWKHRINVSREQWIRQQLLSECTDNDEKARISREAWEIEADASYERWDRAIAEVFTEAKDRDAWLTGWKAWRAWLIEKKAEATDTESNLRRQRLWEVEISVARLKIDLLLERISPTRKRKPSKNKNETKEAAENTLILTDLQIGIMNALKGKSLSVEELANRVTGGDQSRLYKGGGLTKVLESHGLVSHVAGVGYYSTQFPPLERVVAIAPKRKEKGKEPTKK